MKIDLNLSPSQSFRQRHLLAWSVPLLVISLALLVRLVLTIQTNWMEYRAVGRSVEREQDRRNELAAREAALKRQLDEPENRALLREVRFVNSVIDQRQFSFTEMEAKVTSLLPPEVRLTALSMPDSSGEPLIHVGVEGSSEGPVETFLINLEDSPDFRDTMITGAGFDEKGGGAPVGISCTAHYVTGRTEAAARSETKPAGSAQAGTEKAGSKPGTSEARRGTPKELTTAPKVAAGLAAARAHPGVPIKIGAVKPPARRSSGPKQLSPGQPTPSAPAARTPPQGASQAGPTPK